MRLKDFEIIWEIRQKMLEKNKTSDRSILIVCHTTILCLTNYLNKYDVEYATCTKLYAYTTNSSVWSEKV